MLSGLSISVSDVIICACVCVFTAQVTAAVENYRQSVVQSAGVSEMKVRALAFSALVLVISAHKQIRG